MKSNKLKPLNVEVHPDILGQLDAYSKANDYELGYAVEEILGAYFDHLKNLPKTSTRSRPGRASKPELVAKPLAKGA